VSPLGEEALQHVGFVLKQVRPRTRDHDDGGVGGYVLFLREDELGDLVVVRSQRLSSAAL
jgi:hypothetical protein